MKNIMACTCGNQTEVPRIPDWGSVWQCPECREVSIRTRPQRGGEAWVVVRPDVVAFHRLVGDDE